MNEQYPTPPRPDEIDSVYYSNIRDNQIGGLTDGITAEVAEDTGFKRDINPDSTAKIIKYFRHEEEPEPQTQAHATPKKRKSNAPSGPTRGESEADTGKPTYHEAPVVLTPDEKQSGKQGVEEAREVLKKINPDNSAE